MLLVDEVDDKEFLQGLFVAMYEELPEVKVTLPEEEDFPERTERYIKNKIKEYYTWCTRRLAEGLEEAARRLRGR